MTAVSIRHTTRSAWMVPLGFICALVTTGFTSDARAWRGHHGPHHRHAPVVVFRGAYPYPPYPYYYRPRVAAASPAPVQPSVSGATVFVYPQHGQTAEQQQRDEYECYRWAVQQTGTDPVTGVRRTGAMVGVSPPAPDGLPDDPVTGTVGGAALGAAGGALAGDAGTGAAVGAAVGLLAGIVGQANNAVSAAGATVPSAPQGDYQRAFTTCLAGRGYQVG